MAHDLYKRVVSRYAPLCKDSDKHQPTEADIDRAFAIVNTIMPVEWGGKAEATTPAFMEAVSLVNEHGIYIAPEEYKAPSLSFVQRYGRTEVKALINAAALTLVGIEHENGHAFGDSNIEMLMIKTMQELYVGKTALVTKHIELRANGKGH